MAIGCLPTALSTPPALEVAVLSISGEAVVIGNRQVNRSDTITQVGWDRLGQLKQDNVIGLQLCNTVE